MKKVRMKVLILITLMIISFMYSNIIIIKIKGNSMLPTVKNGQYVIATKLAFIKPGDILLVHFVSRNQNDLFLKRLIAKEGHSIRICNSIIYIDNIPHKYGPYVQWTNNNNFDLAGKSLIIPKGYVFVLGDNRNVSQDSRKLGLATVVGKVIFII